MAIAQDFVYDLQLLQVDFSGDSIIPMRYDDGTGLLPVAAQWRSGEIPTAVAYAAGSVPSLSAYFKLNCINNPDSVFIRATGDNDIDLADHVAVAVSPGSDTIYFPPIAATAAFTSDQANYYPDFTFHWEFSFDQLHWYDAGTSVHLVYITRYYPIAENMPAGYGWYESYLFLSCKNAAGLSDTTDIIAAVFNEFTDHSVADVNDHILNYYKKIDCPYYTAPDLLRYRDGECSSWVKLFLSLLKVQGFAFTNDYISISENFTAADCGQVTGFLIKDWEFGTPLGSCTDLPYLNIWAVPAMTDTAYSFMYSEVADAMGISGQTALNPASMFSTHIMAFIGGIYYDPSYGNTYPSIEAFKNNALAGWYYSGSGNETEIEMDVNGNGILDTAPIYNYMRVTDDINFGTLITYTLSW